MENPHPLGQVGPNPLPRNPSPASQSVAVCTRTMLRILMNSASTRVTPSISSKKVKLNAHVNQVTCYQNRCSHSLECCFVYISQFFIVLYSGCVMMDINKYSNCNQKLKAEIILVALCCRPGGLVEGEITW